MIKVAINGFGRIGRRVFRLALNHSTIKIVSINDLADARTLSHLLKYDSVHGVLKEDISYSDKGILVNGKLVPLSNQKDISKIDWLTSKPDIVIEATGKFKQKEQLQHHIKNGASYVILSVPPLDDTIKTIVLGVNDDSIDGNERILSNASCTTNNAAPMIDIMHKNFGVKQAYITTVHSYTTDQSLHDQPHRDLRRARAAGQSIVPTTTGAAKALTKIFPDLADVIGGCGIRVPVPNGSLTDITFNVEKEVDIATINTVFKNASKGYLKGILQYTVDSIVSIDIVGNTNSCVFDSQMTSVIGNMVKIIGWYDNETAYSQRLLDLTCNLSIKNVLLSNK
ncbi:MAG: type I glyceraldehyde-3-phosphate dehydrogenase [Winogradskyella sp.]|uniref:type I glyceraldehyde-3-phosphate dehydrogenase n=1 Tax=Winogradskyella sp. TaxID=1883156 RepID=UPI00183F4280|nr:type I glyceraldehyde-3-phosphate dehydrogenase [Winogradskyella sp.]MBT8244662.1 type I glyceraldehyde-3-phosphate dehydrogenase [Winogradskyella sp.]NNK22456.1 type I glyceraldehyde-3-phosphate dehydrogenase [Winogradskyella sp.]